MSRFQSNATLEPLALAGARHKGIKWNILEQPFKGASGSEHDNSHSSLQYCADGANEHTQLEVPLVVHVSLPYGMVKWRIHTKLEAYSSQTTIERTINRETRQSCKKMVQHGLGGCPQ